MAKLSIKDLDLSGKRVFIRDAAGRTFTPGEFPWRCSFCGWSLASPTPQALIVPDATKDARFAANPFVLGAPHIRFYAGAPVISRGGHRLGTLCIAGTAPRSVSSADVATLATLADLVAVELERDAAAESATRAERRLRAATAAGGGGVSTAPPSRCGSSRRQSSGGSSGGGSGGSRGRAAATVPAVFSNADLDARAALFNSCAAAAAARPMTRGSSGGGSRAVPPASAAGAHGPTQAGTTPRAAAAAAAAIASSKLFCDGGAAADRKAARRSGSMEKMQS